MACSSISTAPSTPNPQATAATITIATPRTWRCSRRLGFNAYRFSIEWARIEPEEGEFSLAQLEHYG